MSGEVPGVVNPLSKPAYGALIQYRSGRKVLDLDLLHPSHREQIHHIEREFMGLIHSKTQVYCHAGCGIAADRDPAGAGGFLQTFRMGVRIYRMRPCPPVPERLAGVGKTAVSRGPRLIPK